jgi:hypothetical protein
MNTENSNCCDTDNSDCNTQETNCCTTEKKTSSNKKKAGLGILLLAITFALVSAFTAGDSKEKASCSTGEASCEASCKTVSTEISCCSK